MDVKKAQILLECVNSGENENVLLGLREIKKRLVTHPENVTIFRNLSIVPLLLKLVKQPNEEVLNRALSVLSLCLPDSTCRKEVHSLDGVRHLLRLMCIAKSENLQMRACRVIGLQSIHGSSSIIIHEEKAASTILGFLKSAQTEEGKCCALKSLRLLGNSVENCHAIYKENGVLIICEEGVIADNLNLAQTALKTIAHFKQAPASPFFQQLFTGTDKFKKLVELYEKKHPILCEEIVQLFCGVILFCFENCNQNDSCCTELMEHFYQEKIFYWMIDLLRLRLQLNLSAYPQLTAALCKLCENKSNIRDAITRDFHEKIWFQLSECNGMSLLVQLFDRNREESTQLPMILKALLGAESIHSQKAIMFKLLVKARFLPSMKELLEEGLNHLIDRRSIGSCEKGLSCGHLISLSRGKRKGSSVLRPDDETPSPSHGIKTNLEVDFDSEEIMQLSDTEDRTVESEVFENHLYWLKMIEYVFRLLYQIISIHEDVSTICREFMPLVCDYLVRAQAIHSSAIGTMVTFTKKTSSIQPLLDTVFIPFIAVELKDSASCKDCTQCCEIRTGIMAVFSHLKQFFTHRHQYGRCEIMSRIIPTKEREIKNKCLLAVPHVVNCPNFLNNVLQQHDCIERLVGLLEDSVDNKPTFYFATAALSALLSNLKTEFGRKGRRDCVFCTANLEAIYGSNRFTPESNNQLMALTRVKCTTQTDLNPCNYEEAADKNVTIRIASITIRANREFLSEKNEVLAAMLSGHFVESESHVVDIKDVNAQCFEMLIHYLYGCRCDLFSRGDVNTYFELILIAQMYFLPNLGIIATHHLVKSVSCVDDITSILDRSLPILNEDVVQHILCASFDILGSDLSRHKWVSEFLHSELKDKFYHYLHGGIKRILNATSLHCTCNLPI